MGGLPVSTSLPITQRVGNSRVPVKAQLLRAAVRGYSHPSVMRTSKGAPALRAPQGLSAGSDPRGASASSSPPAGQSASCARGRRSRADRSVGSDPARGLEAARLVPCREGWMGGDPARDAHRGEKRGQIVLVLVPVRDGEAPGRSSPRRSRPWPRPCRASRTGSTRTPI